MAQAGTSVSIVTTEWKFARLIATSGMLIASADAIVSTKFNMSSDVTPTSHRSSCAPKHRDPAIGENPPYHVGDLLTRIGASARCRVRSLITLVVKNRHEFARLAPNEYVGVEANTNAYPKHLSGRGNHYARNAAAFSIN